MAPHFREGGLIQARTSEKLLHPDADIININVIVREVVNVSSRHPSTLFHFELAQVAPRRNLAYDKYEVRLLGGESKSGRCREFIGLWILRRSCKCHIQPGLLLHCVPSKLQSLSGVS